jgi:hypothetical protein
MGVRIIHYGVDDCHRVPVLKFAGYSIADCQSIVQLRAALQSTEDPGAVVMTEIEDMAPRRAVSIVRSTSSAPLVLFPGRASGIFEFEFEFDLVIPVLTPPEQWLSDMAELIDRWFALRARTHALSAQSALLRLESSRAVRKSQQERMRSRAECAKNRENPGETRYGADSEEHPR